MGSTPVYGLPYPDGTDLVIEGDDALQALALAVEDMHEIEAVAIDEADTGVAVAAGLTAGITFPGTQLDLSGFTYSSGTGEFTRTGAARLYIVSAQVEIFNNSPSAPSFLTEVWVQAGGTVRARSSDYLLTIAPAEIGQRIFTHNICVPVFLGAGTVFNVAATSTDAYTIKRTRISVYPIGPR